MSFQKFKDFSDFLRRRNSLVITNAQNEALHLAVVGWSNLDLFAEILKSQFALNHVSANVIKSGYNSFVLSGHNPEFTVLNFQPLYQIQNSETEIENELQLREQIIQEFRKKGSRLVVIAESAGPTFLDLNLDLEIQQTRERWNHRLEEICSPSEILDLQGLIQTVGSDSFFDFRSWYESKMYFSSQAQIQMAAEVFRLHQNQKRQLTKVLALDLDQTLWHGILAESELSEIRIGGHDPVGEFFYDFQMLLRKLKDLGILLTLVTKNDEDQVRDALQKLPMPLKENDFVGIWAGWNPKHQSLLDMSQKLGLALDQILFIDDDLFEISEAQAHLPDLQTLHLDVDLEKRSGQLLDALNWHKGSVTAEDSLRTQSYQRIMKASSGDLADLSSQVELREFQKQDLGRIHQLFQKTNQFNQRTQRRTLDEISQILDSNQGLRGFSYTVSDRFGDLGLVGAVITKMEDEILWIEDWVMSCRSLNRQISETVITRLKELFPEAREVHLKARKTPRNHPFFDSLSKLNFTEYPSMTPNPDEFLFRTSFRDAHVNI